MDDSGFEEQIPGVNTYGDERGLSHLMLATETLNVSSPIKSSIVSAVSPVSTGMTSPTTPRDSEEHAPDFLVSNSSPDLVQLKKAMDFQNSSAFQKASRPVSSPTDGISSYFIPMQHGAAMVDQQAIPHPGAGGSDDDDLYFDDGMIEDFEANDDKAFDESVFDDETNGGYELPLRYSKPRDENADERRAHDNHPLAVGISGPQSSVAEIGSSYIQAAGASEGKSALPSFHGLTKYQKQSDQAPPNENVGLTHDNLAAYLHQAALNGAFTRRGSSSQEDKSPGQQAGYSSRHYPDAGLDGECSNVMPLNFDAAANDNPDFDDSLVDDPIIAAANAEALENDDDGFYGQEFGFYARASGSDDAAYANGGYFGGPGIGRSKSGRAIIQEPSLTPITERSEWSNRNSAISLALISGMPLSAQSISTQGQTQLADLMHGSEEDLSFSALMKLRRGAWGGSNPSLHSSSGSLNNSPVTYLSQMGNSNTSLPFSPPGNASSVSPTQQIPAVMHHSFPSASNLAASFSSNSSSDVSNSSPTVTLSQSHPSLIQLAPSFPEPIPEQRTPSADEAPISPLRQSMLPPTVKQKGKSHSRNSSSGESVSYVEDGGRWFLEKRRVTAGGEVEVVGREIVVGGRI